ncbi:hypothetical protein TIFTF001_014669 [Ficus carica]|uniref:Uncharacterized protein n=1 Tax=Ficus carica TaxID=3494 RepID=A0AA88AGF6_FICCA|nr:hypothetical protein TIFTF001_014669 [Ficus carica]
MVEPRSPEPTKCPPQIPAKGRHRSRSDETPQHTPFQIQLSKYTPDSDISAGI